MENKKNYWQIVYGLLDIIIGGLFIFEAVNDFYQVMNPDNAGAALALAILFIFIIAFFALIFLFGILFVIYGLIFILSAVRFKGKIIAKRWMIISIIVIQIILLICILFYAIQTTGVSQIIGFIAFGLLLITSIIKIVDLVLTKKRNNSINENNIEVSSNISDDLKVEDENKN